MKTEYIRKTFPKVREVQRASGRFFQVDARRRGTRGKQEHFTSKEDAIERAKVIAEEFNANGTEGLALDQQLRAAALRGEAMLKPFGKTISQAHEYYRDHLLAEQKKEESSLVKTIAKEWHATKKTENLKPRTIQGIRQASSDLAFRWGSDRIRAITTADIRKHLTSLPVSNIRRDNVRNLFNQFFSWCMNPERKYISENPCQGIKFNVEKKDEVAIFKAAVVEKALRYCVDNISELVLYVAISAFAGLRPGEAEGLLWENIHLEEKTIKVLGSTSKSKETHNIPIEDNLLAWLKAYPGEGHVTPQGKTLERRKRMLHVALGYKADGQNEAAEEMPQDVWRHSYASHWIAKYTNRSTLAEYMANSLDVIKQHYKAVVTKSEMENYWNITPTTARRRKNYLPKHLQKAA